MLGVHQLINLGKLPNYWTDREHISHTYADPSACEWIQLAKKYPFDTPMGIVGGGGVRGHIFNCGKTATNTCIISITLRLSLAKPGNPASETIFRNGC